MLCFYIVIFHFAALRGPEPSKNAKRKWKDKTEDDKKVAVENVNCSFTGEEETDTVEVMPEKIQLKPSIDV